MNDIEFLYLNQTDIRATGVAMEMAMDTVEDAFRLHHQGLTNLPFKTVLDLGERERGRGNAMPGYVGGDYDVFGIKWIAGFPKNPVRHGLPRATGFFVLNDSWKGVPLAVMDCTLLSAIRTGAVTGVGARYMARPDSQSAAIIGTGVQARMQIEALKIVIPGLKEVRAFDIRREAAEKFAGEMSEKLSLTVKAVDSAEVAVRDADIVVTVTVADEPIVMDAWMKRGSFFSAVGSYQEEEFAVVTSSDRVVVDGLEHVLHRETPVIALMIKKGLIKKEEIIELGQIVSGEKAGRAAPEERVFFSPIGMAIAGHAVMASGEIACTSEAWGLRSTDPRAMVLISELQVDDVTMTRLAYYLAYGCPIYIAFTPLIGGYGGGPDGTAIVAVASFIASVLLGGEIAHIGPQHIKFKQQTNQHSLFLAGLANQAVAKNSHIIATTSHTTTGRPGSAQYAREFSALALTAVTSGSNVSGPRPAEPMGYNNVSPLMARLFAEVAHAAAGMKREQAAHIVEQLHGKYRDKILIEEAPAGKSFEELYDLETLTPTPEHQALYDEVKDELIQTGIPLK